MTIFIWLPTNYQPDRHDRPFEIAATWYKLLEDISLYLDVLGR